MSLNCDVGSDSQGRYLPSKYFNPQLITWWVQWVEVWGCGVGWGGLKATWGGLSWWPGTFFLSVTRPFFRGDCGKSQTGRPPEWAAGWQEVLTQALQKVHVGACMWHAHPCWYKSTWTPMNKWFLINKRYDSICHWSKCEIGDVNEHCECASLSSSA